MNQIRKLGRSRFSTVATNSSLTVLCININWIGHRILFSQKTKRMHLIFVSHYIIYVITVHVQNSLLKPRVRILSWLVEKLHLVGLRAPASAMPSSHPICWPGRGINRGCYHGSFVSWNMEAAIPAATMLASPYFPTQRRGHQSASVREINSGASSREAGGLC